MDDDSEQNTPVSPYFRLWLCGAFRVERRIGTVYEVIRATEWAGSSYPRLLLKALLCCPGRQARRDALLDMLWPEADPEQALQYLNTATTKLRKVLEPSKGHPSLLHTEEDCRLYRLAGQSLLWVDVDAALTLLRNVERMEETTAEVSSLLEEAMTYLDAGPVLADDDGLWLTERRGEVEVACYTGRLRLAEAYERQGMVVQAELQLRKLLADDPTDEDVLGCVMHLLHRHGMKHRALRYYKEFTEVAEQEGLEPTEESKLLAESMRSEQQRSVIKLKRRCREWGLAPLPAHFYGRSSELRVLKSWLAEQQCRVVAIVGIGGIGKTSLAIVGATQMQDSFEYVLWRSLQHAPPLHHLLQEAIPFFSDQQQTEMPHAMQDQVALLMESLRAHRCLLILDNVETVLQEGTATGSYRAGYEGYGTFFQLVGEAKHRSCLLLTSREKPKELARLEGCTAPVRVLHLSGVGVVEGQAMLKDTGLFGSEDAWSRLIELYAGNPLALQLVAEPIREVFHANIAAFLKEGNIVMGDLHTVLDQQFNRLSAGERDMLYWLAIEREAVSLETLWQETVAFVSKQELLDSLASLRRRFLIETPDTAHFTLQPVIMGYVTEAFTKGVSEEIEREGLFLLACHALTKAQAKEYVREAQVRLILTPVGERLFTNMGREEIEQKCKALLSRLHEVSAQKPSYAAGNLLTLLIHMHSDLRGYDFSRLQIRQAFLQGALLPEVNFAYADLATSIFADTFGSILSVAFHLDGNVLAAGTASGEVRLWNAHGAPLQTCHGHTDWVRSVALSPDGRTLVSGSHDQTVRLWDVSSGQCLKTFQGHTNRVRSVAFSPDGTMIASGSEDQTVHLWDVSSGHCLKILQGHTHWTYAVTFSPDGTIIASGGEDQVIRLWDVSSGHCLKVLQGHTNRIHAVTFSPNGAMIASGGEDQTVHLWDVSSGHCLKILQGHTHWTYAVTFSPDGTIIASGGEDQVIRLWDVSSGHCLKILRGHTGRVRSIAFSFDGRTLVSGGEDNALRMWDVDTGQCLKTLLGHTSRIRSVAFSPDSNTLASGGEEPALCLWDMTTGRYFTKFQEYTNHIHTVIFSPDGHTLASGGEEPPLRLWDVRSGYCLKAMQGHTGWIYSIAFSPDGSMITSGGNDQIVCLWDTSSGQCLNILPGHTDRVRSVAFSPDGSLIASGSEDQTVRLWDVSSGRCLNILQGHTNRIWSIDFSPDGNTLVSGSHDQTVRLWNVSSGQCLKTFQGHIGRIWSVAFSADGSLVASGSEDQTVRLWDITREQCLRTLSGHIGWIWSLSFSRDGHTLVSGSDDGTIKHWEVSTGACIQTLRYDRPYERMNITGTRGLATHQQAILKRLGAIEDRKMSE